MLVVGRSHTHTHTLARVLVHLVVHATVLTIALALEYPAVQLKVLALALALLLAAGCQLQRRARAFPVQDWSAGTSRVVLVETGALQSRISLVLITWSDIGVVALWAEERRDLVAWFGS